MPNEDFDLPPTMKAEWEQCIQNEEFCRALAGKLLNYNEEIMISIAQGLRQGLLSKHAIERQVLAFLKIEYGVQIAASIAQLALYTPLKLCAIIPALEMFTIDIAKSGITGIGIIYICYPLYSEMSFKLDSIIMLIVEHFYFIKFKPNEYSLENYQLAMQIRTAELIHKLYTLLFYFKQTLLWLNMRLIENCIMRLENKSLDEYERFIQMSTHYEDNV